MTQLNDMLKLCLQSVRRDVQNLPLTDSEREVGFAYLQDFARFLEVDHELERATRSTFGLILFMFRMKKLSQAHLGAYYRLSQSQARWHQVRQMAFYRMPHGEPGLFPVASLTPPPSASEPA